MQTQSSTIKENGYEHISVSHNSYAGRKRLEMNRRMTLLQYKRGYLERELRAIHNALDSLVKQLS